MRAYISSSVDASILLHGLEERAGGMAEYSINLNGHALSENRTPLRLMKTLDGRPAYVTISRYNEQTLLASLENEEGLVGATAKRCLAALLIPLVTEYVGTHHSGLTTGDSVQIAFDETKEKRRQGKRCVLFAEAAANQLGF